MKQYISKVLFCALALILINIHVGRAQVKGPAQTFIEKEVVYWDYHSVTIGDDYTIYVHVPPGYDTTKIKYPVLYITDGDWDKNTASNSFNMLRQDYITNEAVIVGIGYGDRPNQRNRDLLPAKGAPNFLAFIEKEVIPFIESKYRVTDDRTLSGYSYGGTFVAHVLFNRPGLFNTICIGAPGLSSELVPEAQKYFAANKDLKARVFLSVGSYEHETVNNIALFKDYLLKQNCKNLEVETGIVPNASHGAAKPKVIQDGIEFAFCKKHKAITLSASELEKYAGTYDQTGRPDKKLKIYVENSKLYFVDNGLPSELTPFTKDGFFQYENQRGDIFFKVEGGKMYIDYVPYNQKPIRSFERAL
ncbi:MAG TPA: alpha/beta hydrolase-fold protein [Mucilaginibacter sp.]